MNDLNIAPRIFTSSVHIKNVNYFVNYFKRLRGALTAIGPGQYLIATPDKNFAGDPVPRWGGSSKTLNQADTQLINEQVPKSTSWSILSIHVYKIIAFDVKNSFGSMGNCASVAFTEAEQKEKLKTQEALFGELQRQVSPYFQHSLWRTRSRLE